MAHLKVLDWFQRESFFLDIATVDWMDTWDVPWDEGDAMEGLLGTPIENGDRLRERGDYPDVIHFRWTPGSLRSKDLAHREIVLDMVVISYQSDRKGAGVVFEQGSAFLLADNGDTIDRL